MLTRLAARLELRDRNVPLLVTNSLPASAAGWMLGAALPLYLKGAGLSMVSLGGIFTVKALLAAALSPPAGWVADRYDRARTHAAATLLLWIAALVLLAPAAPGVILLYLLLAELGANLAWSSRYTLTLDLVRKRSEEESSDSSTPWRTCCRSRWAWRWGDCWRSGSAPSSCLPPRSGWWRSWSGSGSGTRAVPVPAETSPGRWLPLPQR